MNQTSRNLINFGTYFYDYSGGVSSVGQMRIEQRQCPEGQYPNFKRVRSCILYLKNHNVYKYTQNDGVCCLAMTGLGPTPPNWLNTATFVSQTKYLNQPVSLYHYVDNDGYPHQYYESIGEHPGPVAFGDGGSANEFNLFIPGVIPSPTIFNLPPNCTSKCTSDSNIANIHAKHFWELF